MQCKKLYIVQCRQLVCSSNWNQNRYPNLVMEISHNEVWLYYGIFTLDGTGTRAKYGNFHITPKPGKARDLVYPTLYCSWFKYLFRFRSVWIHHYFERHKSVLVSTLIKLFHFRLLRKPWRKITLASGLWIYYQGPFTLSIIDWFGVSVTMLA